MMTNFGCSQQEKMDKWCRQHMLPTTNWQRSMRQFQNSSRRSCLSNQSKLSSVELIDCGLKCMAKVHDKEGHVVRAGVAAGDLGVAELGVAGPSAGRGEPAAAAGPRAEAVAQQLVVPPDAVTREDEQLLAAVEHALADLRLRGDGLPLGGEVRAPFVAEVPEGPREVQLPTHARAAASLPQDGPGRRDAVPLTLEDRLVLGRHRGCLVRPEETPRVADAGDHELRSCGARRPLAPAEERHGRCGALELGRGRLGETAPGPRWAHALPRLAAAPPAGRE